MKELSFICCSVLRRELSALFDTEYPGAEICFLDSRLHLYPQRLHLEMDKALAARGHRACVLIYGDCHAHMNELSQRRQCSRTDAVNCSELLLGREAYRRCRAGKTFIFLPEWTKRWREIFEKELGFTDQPLAREFMQDNQRSLLYLDTGLSPVPQTTLAEIADYFAMPVEIMPISLQYLKDSVRSAVARLMTKAAHES
jgi:hypothetical protein